VVDGISPTPGVPEREEGNPTPRVDLAHPSTSDAPVAPPAADPLANWSGAQSPAMGAANSGMPTPNLPGLPGVANVPGGTPNKRRTVLLVSAGLILLGLLGGGIYLALNRAQEPTAVTPAPTPQPTEVNITNASPTNLTQSSGTGTAITTGGATNATSLSFSWDLPAGAENAVWTPQVEVQPLTTPFTNEPSTTATAEIKGTTAVVTITGLADTTYHWQARFTEGVNAGPWAPFGENEETVADFAIDTVAPVAPAIATIDGTAVTGSSVSITNNRPVFAGTTEPAAKVSIQIPASSTTLAATADASGAWTATPDADLPNGSTALSLTATDVAGNVSSAGSQTLALNSSTTAPAVTQGLASTGDATQILNLLGFMLMVGSLVTLGWIRRHAKL
jgi:large repetitive protein